MDQEVHPSVVLMAPFSFSMATQSSKVKNTKKTTWQVSLPTSLRQSNPLLVTDEQETCIYLSESQCPVSCPLIELPTQLSSSLSAPWASPALQDPFRHIPVCCTSYILAAPTLLVEYASRLTHCKTGESGLRIGARLSLASKIILHDFYW